MVCLLVLAVNSPQPRTSWEENLNEKLSRLGWHLGMSMGDSLWFRKTTHPVVGGAIFQARNPKRGESEQRTSKQQCICSLLSAGM